MGPRSIHTGTTTSTALLSPPPTLSQCSTSTDYSRSTSTSLSISCSDPMHHRISGLCPMLRFSIPSPQFLIHPTRIPRAIWDSHLLFHVALFRTSASRSGGWCRDPKSRGKYHFGEGVGVLEEFGFKGFDFDHEIYIRLVKVMRNQVYRLCYAAYQSHFAKIL